jgi:hypothetical protein
MIIKNIDRVLAAFTICVLAAVVFLATPAIAQEVFQDTGPTWKGISILPLISALATIVTGLFAWLGRKIGAANDAAKDKSTVEAAFIRLGAVAFAMAGDLWTKLSTEYQTRIADGSFDAADREAFKTIIGREIERYTSREELVKLAEATKLPLPGVIAWVAEWIIDRLTKANDPDIVAVPSMYAPREVEPPYDPSSQGG